MSLAYLFDGSTEGLMSAIFCAYANREDPEDLIRPEHTQIRLGQEIREIPTDFTQAERVASGIKRQLGKHVLQYVLEASACDKADTGTIVYRFVRYAMKSKFAMPCSNCCKRQSCNTACVPSKGKKLLSEWANPAVGPLLDLQRHVYAESEKIRQFVRFQHTSEGYWFARCNPNAAVLPFVMDWFAARFNTQDFVIYDETHGVAGMSQGGYWQLVKSDTINIPENAPEEALMQDAWQRFYQALSIESRYNPELRQHFMPKRFWKNLTELQTEQAQGIDQDIFVG